MSPEIPYRYTGPRRTLDRTSSTRAAARRASRSTMKQLISHQLVKYLEDRGVEYLFGLCGHTNIAVLAALQGLEDQVRQHAARADRRAHRRRLRARQADHRRRAVAPRARADQRLDRRGQRGARLDPDGGDRRRHPEPLLRQASAPGGEPARRRVAVRDLPAVRQARLARRAARPVPRDHREGVPARRERPARAGAGLGADGHLLDGDRHRAVRAPATHTRSAAQAVDGRADRREDRARAGSRPSSR